MRKLGWAFQALLLLLLSSRRRLQVAVKVPLTFLRRPSIFHEAEDPACHRNEAVLACREQSDMADSEEKEEEEADKADCGGFFWATFAVGFSRLSERIIR